MLVFPIQCHRKWPLHIPDTVSWKRVPLLFLTQLHGRCPSRIPNTMLCFVISPCLKIRPERQYGLRQGGFLLQKGSQENLNLNSNFLKAKISLSDLSMYLLYLPTRREHHVLPCPHHGFRSEGLIDHLTPIARGNPFSTQSRHLTKQKRRC